MKNQNEIEKKEQKEAQKGPQKEEKKLKTRLSELEKELKEAKENEEKLSSEAETSAASLKEAEEKYAKEKDDYLRLRADFDNFRRRSAEDRLNLISSAASDTIKGLLPVLDSCERALKQLEGTSDAAAKEGTELIYKSLTDYLKTKGLEQIKDVDEKFDTDFHEAVAQIPAGDEKKGLVVDVITRGYTLNGKVLRYAQVVVGC